MRAVLTIAVSALAAFTGHRLGHAVGSPARADSPDTTELRAKLDELRRETVALARALEQHPSELVAVPAATEAASVDEGEIAAACERRLAAHPPSVALASASTPVESGPLGDDLDLAQVPIGELVAALGKSGITQIERQELFQRLREAGRMDEFVKTMEELAAADPENAELQVALGNAYLQKLFEIGNQPEAGTYAMKSDAAFDRALEIDDHNWAARFTKAVSLSNWPAFLGRGPEAIEHFEVLLEQQGEGEVRPEYSMTYLFLGNMYQAAGEREEAIATWKAGLELFPRHEELRSALELAEKP